MPLKAKLTKRLAEVQQLLLKYRQEEFELNAALAVL